MQSFFSFIASKSAQRSRTTLFQAKWILRALTALWHNACGLPEAHVELQDSPLLRRNRSLSLLLSLACSTLTDTRTPALAPKVRRNWKQRDLRLKRLGLSRFGQCGLASVRFKAQSNTLMTYVFAKVAYTWLSGTTEKSVFVWTPQFLNDDLKRYSIFKALQVGPIFFCL